MSLRSSTCLCPQLWNVPLCFSLIMETIAAQAETAHSTQPVDLTATQAS